MRLTILCVDDEKIILNSLKTQLKSAFGNTYAYEMADNGFDALELIEELTEDGYVENIIVIVCDWLMPGMKGDELLIKIHKLLPQAIKLMLTGQADEKAVQRAVSEANLYKCLEKPWREEDLINCIRTATSELIGP